MWTYLLRCRDGTLYCGWTTDFPRRLRNHNEGKGAKYTAARLPARPVYLEWSETKQEAMRREWAIKQMTRREKERMLEEQLERTQTYLAGMHLDGGEA